MAAARAVSQSYARLAPTVKIVVELPKTYIPLESENTSTNNPDNEFEQLQKKLSIPKEKSFKLHVGGNLSIPSVNANAKPQYSHQDTSASNIYDPFEGLPFRSFAEKLGESIMPAISAAREEQRRTQIEGKYAAQNAEPIVPHVPHVLPFTRWAANSNTMRSTFIADDPSTRKKARLSWYHPDDGMVPRGWWKGGLLADLKYYNPFGLLSTSNNSAATA